MAGCQLEARRTVRGARRAVFVAVLCALSLIGARAQMEQPLMGQGDQQAEKTTIHMSVFLERLLDIDDKNFRFTCVLFFYLNWRDPRAYGTIWNRTVEVRNGGEPCERVCTGPEHGRSTWQPCCDSVWMPDLKINNAEELPEGRIDMEEIGVVGADLDIVTWFKKTQGTFYTTMDFRDFPFDEQTLVIDILLDGQGGDGSLISIEPSAGGFGGTQDNNGFDMDGWVIEDVSLVKEIFSSNNTFSHVTQLPAAADPAPAVSTASKNSVFTFDPASGTAFVEAIDVMNNTMQRIQVKIEVVRVWYTFVMTLILPIMLSVWLCSIVFLVNPGDLDTRIGSVVTLFLALVAVQFITVDVEPASQNVIATQQLVILTYFYLGVAGVESLIVYHVYMAYSRDQLRIRLFEAEKKAVRELATKGVQLTRTMPMRGMLSRGQLSKSYRRRSSEFQLPEADQEMPSSPERVAGQSDSQLQELESMSERSEPRRSTNGASGHPKALQADKERKEPCGGCRSPSRPQGPPATTNCAQIWRAVYYLPRNIRNVEDYGTYVAHIFDTTCFYVWLLTYHILAFVIFYVNDSTA